MRNFNYIHSRHEDAKIRLERLDQVLAVKTKEIQRNERAHRGQELQFNYTKPDDELTMDHFMFGAAIVSFIVLIIFGLII